MIVAFCGGTARLAIDLGLFEDGMFSALWKVGIVVVIAASGAAFVRR